MATDPVKVELIAPGVQSQSKIIQEAFLAINKVMDLTVKGVSKVNKVGAAMDGASTKFRNIAAEIKKIGNSFVSGSSDVKTFEAAVKTATKGISDENRKLLNTIVATRAAQKQADEAADAAITKHLAARGKEVRKEEEASNKLIALTKEAGLQARAEEEKTLNKRLAASGKRIRREERIHNKLVALTKEAGLQARDEEEKTLNKRLAASGKRIRREEKTYNKLLALTKEAGLRAREVANKREAAAAEAALAEKKSYADGSAAAVAAGKITDATIAASKVKRKAAAISAAIDEKKSYQEGSAAARVASKIAQKASEAAKTKRESAAAEAALAEKKSYADGSAAARVASKIAQKASEAAKQKKIADLKKVQAVANNARFGGTRSRKATSAVDSNLGRRQLQRRSGPQGNILEKSAVAAAEANLRNLAKTTKITGRQMNQVFADVNSGAIRSYSGTLARVQAGVVRLQKAEAGLGATAQKAHAKAAAAAKKHQKALDGTRAKAFSLKDSLKSLASIAGVSLFIGGLFQIQQALVDGVEAAIEFSKRIAEIQTIQGDSATTTEVWSRELRKLSDSYGIPIIDQAEAAYQTLSNQVAKGTDAILFQVAANKLAVAAVTDVSTATNLLTSVVNAFGRDALEAEDIAAKLFKTVELGRVRIDEMSETLGRIAVPAAKLGVRMEELFAAIAVTTRQGIRFNEASTLMRGILLKLVKPTKEMKDLFQSLGFASAEAAIAALGLPGVLAEIDKKAQGSSTELAKLFNRVRGTTGALIFAGKGLELFQEELDKVDASNIEELGDKVEIVAKSLGKRFEIEVTKINNIFKKVGQDTLQILLKVNDSLGGVSTVIQDVIDKVEKLIRISKPLVKILETLPSLGDALFIGKLQEVVGAIVGFVGNLLDVTGGAVEAEKAIAALNVTLEDAATGATAKREKAELALTKNILAGFKERTRESILGLARESAALFVANKERLDSLKDIKRESDTSNRDAIKGIKALASASGTEFKKLTSGASKTAADITKTFLAAGKALFAFDIGVSVDLGKLKVIDSQIGKLQSERQAAIASGDKANFERVTKQIADVGKLRLTVTQKVAKEEAKASLDVSKARAELIRAGGAGDKNRIQAAKFALKDAKRNRNLVGSVGQEELKVQNEIVKIRRKIRSSKSGSVESKALRAELQGLLGLEGSILDRAKQAAVQRKKIADAAAQQIKDRIALEDKLIEKAEEAVKKRINLQRIGAELLDLDKQRRNFKLEELFGKESDPKKLTAEIEKQAAIIRKSITLQEKLGVSAAERTKSEKEIAAIREAGLAQSRILEIAESSSKKLRQNNQFEQDLADLRTLDSENNKVDAKRLAAFQANASEALKALRGISKTDFRDSISTDAPARGGRAGEKKFLIETEGLRREMTLVISDLATEISRGSKGSAANLEKFTGQLEKLLARSPIGDRFDRKTKTLKTAKDRDRDPVFERIFSDLRRSLGSGAVDLAKAALTRANTIKRLEQFNVKEITTNKTRALIAEADADDRADFRLQSAKIEAKQLKQREDNAKEEAAREARQFSSPAFRDKDFVSLDPEQAKKDLVAATKATHDTVVKNNVDGAVAGEKAVIKFRKEAADRLLKDKESANAKARKLQTAVDSSGGRLTGYAARVKAADSGRGISGGSIRKRQAEQRAAQRKRNADFINGRIDKRGIERGQPLKGTDPKLITAEIAKLTSQLAKAADETEFNKIETKLNKFVEFQRLQDSKKPGVKEPSSRLLGTADTAALSNIDRSQATISNTDAIKLLTNSFQNLSKTLDSPFKAQDPDFKSQLRPYTPRLRDGFAEPQEAMQFNPITNVQVQIDSKDLASHVTKQVDLNLDRKGRQGTRKSK